MLNSLAIWHYPHRTMVDNIRFFAAHGFPALSVHGRGFSTAAKDPAAAEVLAEVVRETGIRLTVHHALPRDHSPETVARFTEDVEAISAWQARHGLVAVLSFDVPQAIRDRVGGYLDFVLDRVAGCPVAVEDFGLTAAERAQIEHLKSNPRFGYLVDLGHTFIRLRGQRTDGRVLFSNAPDEHPPVAAPDYAAFLSALRSKEFPIFEMHLHNNDGVKDTHLFLEDGPLDIPMIARVLRDFGFDGILTIESAPGYQFPCYGEEADEGILRTYAYWRRCLES